MFLYDRFYTITDFQFCFGNFALFVSKVKEQHTLLVFGQKNILQAEKKKYAQVLHVLVILKRPSVLTPYAFKERHRFCMQLIGSLKFINTRAANVFGSARE